MGSISYAGLVIHVDDRTLAHLQIVIVRKLARGDSLLMSWRNSPASGSGRSSIWLHPHIHIQFRFDGGRVASINEEWLAHLADSADSSRGLIVVDEHDEVARLHDAQRGKRTTVLAGSESEHFRARP